MKLIWMNGGQIDGPNDCRKLSKNDGSYNAGRRTDGLAGGLSQAQLYFFNVNLYFFEAQLYYFI